MAISVRACVDRVSDLSGPVQVRDSAAGRGPRSAAMARGRVVGLPAPRRSPGAVRIPSSARWWRASWRRFIAIGSCSLSRIGSSAMFELPVVGEFDDRGVEAPVRVVAARARRSQRRIRSSAARTGSARIRARRSGSAVSTAWRSRTWRSANSCRMSAGDQSVTRDPRRGRCSTSPCWLEQPQRLAQRRPADAEFGAQLLLEDLLARLQAPAEDRVAEPVGGELDEGRGQLSPRSVRPRHRHPQPPPLASDPKIVDKRRNFSRDVLDRAGARLSAPADTSQRSQPAVQAAAVGRRRPPPRGSRRAGREATPARSPCRRAATPRARR